MPKEIKQILFDNNYPKIHNQKHARLVMGIQGLLGEMLLKNFPDLTFFDTLRDDGIYYDIKPEESYMLLLFVGDKEIMFSTLRKQNEENAILYAESVGEVYRLKIEPKGIKYGIEQRNKK